LGTVYHRLPGFFNISGVERKNSVAAALEAFPGALLVVSHDGDFLANIRIGRALELARPGNPYLNRR
jgi:hypothetical protein